MEMARYRVLVYGLAALGGLVLLVVALVGILTIYQLVHPSINQALLVPSGAYTGQSGLLGNSIPNQSEEQNQSLQQWLHSLPNQSEEQNQSLQQWLHSLPNQSEEQNQSLQQWLHSIQEAHPTAPANPWAKPQDQQIRELQSRVSSLEQRRQGQNRGWP